MEQDAINGKVNGLANRMDGNSAANLLDGGAGNRALFGGSGNDPLQGGGDDYLEGGAGGCCCARQDPSDAKPRRNGAVAFF